MPAYIAEQERADEVINFVQTKTGVWSPLGAVQAMGFADEDTGELVGAWMFERYTGEGGSVHVHWAARDSKKWLTPDMLRLVAIYAFDQLGVDLLYGEVRASDKRTREIDERLGFGETVVLPAYFPDDDLIVYSMARRQCRWLPAEYKEPLDE